MNRDGHIRVLPLHVANKIAAGEVVERPASVVKELVENSIDAGAANIKISVSGGGRKLVSVSDDGSGMTRDDALLSLERQATSKILDVGDIENIDTLGFRGEALPSIASVSRFTLTTRRRDSDEGTEVAVNAGILAGVRSAGCPPGTHVEVRDLFCNVPARKKFLRAYSTEESHIKHVFTQTALSHPSIGFSLWSDGRETYRLAPADSSGERMRGLFGESCLDGAARLSGECGEVEIDGWIQLPGASTAGWRDQYVFVNGRPASSPSIAHALRETYPRKPGDARPAVVMFIRLPPGKVDVNVHPAKREVRFRDNAAVKEAIALAVHAALSGAAPVRNHPASSGASFPPAADEAADAVFQGAAGSRLPSFATTQLAVPPARLQMLPSQTTIEFAVDPSSTASKPWKWFKFLSTTDSGYILIETDSGMVTIHPQAARERLAYEAVLARDGGSVESQELLLPETVRLSPADASCVAEALPELRKAGFAIDEFGRDVFKIDAVPSIAQAASAAQILSTVARDLAEPGRRRAGSRWKEEAVARSVARSCAGMALAADEAGATKLVEELASCRMPYVCPSGRPTMIFTSNAELARKFSRG